MKKIEPYFLDDKVIIPENIEKMSKQELEQEIKRLEKEVVERKTKNQKLAAIV